MHAFPEVLLANPEITPENSVGCDSVGRGEWETPRYDRHFASRVRRRSSGVSSVVIGRGLKAAQKQYFKTTQDRDRITAPHLNENF